MPKKLESCVRKVMRRGKSESFAYGACTKSTGQKARKSPAKKGKRK